MQWSSWVLHCRASVFYILYSTFYILHSTFHIFYILYILHSTFYILFSIFYSLHSTFYILRSVFYILYSTFHILALPIIVFGVFNTGSASQGLQSSSFYFPSPFFSFLSFSLLPAVIFTPPQKVFFGCLPSDCSQLCTSWCCSGCSSELCCAPISPARTTPRCSFHPSHPWDTCGRDGAATWDGPQYRGGVFYSRIPDCWDGAASLTADP